MQLPVTLLSHTVTVRPHEGADPYGTSHCANAVPATTSQSQFCQVDASCVSQDPIQLLCGFKRTVQVVGRHVAPESNAISDRAHHINFFSKWMREVPARAPEQLPMSPTSPTSNGWRGSKIDPILPITRSIEEHAAHPQEHSQRYD